MKYDDPAPATVQEGANSCCLRRAEMTWAADDIVFAVTEGRTVSTDAFDKLPPWRAVLYARLADATGATFEHGDVQQMHQAAAKAGGHAGPGWWRAALGLEPVPALTQQPSQPYVAPTGWKVVRHPNSGPR